MEQVLLGQLWDPKIIIFGETSRFSFSTQTWYISVILLKTDIEGFETFQPTVGIELTSLTITGLEVRCSSNSVNVSCLASLRL